MTDYKTLAEYGNVPFYAGVEEVDTDIYAALSVMLGGPKRGTCEITRPANTTDYAIGDVIADDAAGVETQYIEVGRLDGKSGQIIGVSVKTDNPAWEAGIRIVFYDAPPTSFTADNSAWPGTLYADSAIGQIDVNSFVADGEGAGVAAMGAGLPVFPVNFQCESDSKNIYFQLYIPDVAATPASAQKFTVAAYYTQM